MMPDDDDTQQIRDALKQNKRKPRAPSNVIQFPGVPRPHWFSQCILDKKGDACPNLANVMVALQNDPAFEGVFEFDEMRQDAMILRNIPLIRDKPAPPPGRIVSDDDVGRLQDWLQHNWLPRISRETVGQAIHLRAREFRRHPVKEWYQSLQWDGHERLSIWLKVYLGAQEQPDDYLATIGRMFLIAMVARVFEPGCKADYMPVLEGPQGIEKSRACQVLAGEYFSDSLPDIASKDARQHLRGKQLVEIAELAAFTKAEIEPLKAFLTRTHERYRPPFGRNDVEEPRQCLFVGTTNKFVYIKDETGARRFWPIKCGVIKIDDLIRDREQLFAEAVERFHHGEQYWPDAETERLLIKPQQERRIESDPWEEAIKSYVDGELPKIEKDFKGNIYGDGNWPKINFARILQVAREALNFDTTARIGTGDQRRIAGVFEAMGWDCSKRDNKGRYFTRG